MRRQMLQKRNSQVLGDRVRLSIRIQDHVIKSKEFQSAQIIGAYFTFGSEVMTDSIIAQSKKLGKKVALPSVEGDRITFYEFSSNKYLVKGRFGIVEPLPYSPIDKLDLLVVPGIAFDKKGYRLGYGQGYYDRLLSDKKIFSIGLAYSSQLIENMPRDEHDRQLDAIATEGGIHYT
ncbi:MAG TPA: 5-formyltetrahydrofolate cyclo-ligase [Nitrososphaera sp.]|nr:5-formyltetrahydrofolate cyclo-ligase [Nitrososphaera sp.]